jgi:uncharacterized protein YbjT (DUF2867 family)
LNSSCCCLAAAAAAAAAGEQQLRASGLPFVIVRAPWLDDGPAGRKRIHMGEAQLLQHDP